MQKKIAVLSGDGIGPEIVSQAIKTLKAVEKKFDYKFLFEEALVGAAAIDDCNDPYPDATHQLCEEADAILFGAIGHPKFDNDPSAKIRPEQGLLKMRSTLGLYANVRPIKCYDALVDASPLKPHIIKDVDFVVIRELISGIYFGQPRGRTEDGNKAFDTCVYSKEEILRITKQAFQFAEKRKQKVTLLDKANVLATSRLWREVVTEYANQHPHIEFESNFIDSAAMHVIQDPKRYDVILTGNLFGDIISDEASVITGSLGILPSASLGEKTSMFEPIHGSYPQAAGQNRANPIATILSAAMLLEYGFDMKQESDIINAAVEKALTNNVVTEDINNGKFSTEQVGDQIAKYILEY